MQPRSIMAADVNSKIGLRVFCDGHYGTVKYFGEVPPSSGEWFGIEWDEEGRGKHNGVHGGVKYFECSRATNGSFVRAGKLDFGVSDVEALLGKFNDFYDEQQSENLEFFYHVGRNDKHDEEEKLRQLKHVVLRWSKVSHADTYRTLCSIAPNIVELDLTKTLLSDWREVLKIVEQLPRLVKLDVSENRLRNVDRYYKTVLHTCPLKVLVVNKTGLTWQQVLTLSATFPQLQELCASYNNIESLQGGDLGDVKQLRKLDLEGNSLSSWSDILLLEALPALESLALSHTKLGNIYFPGDNGETAKLFLNLRCLLLSKTMVADWSSINQLDRLAAFEVLSLQECPLLQEMSEYDARCEIIARISKCCRLNNSSVTAKERQVSERAYLKKYSKEWLSCGGCPEKTESNVDTKFTHKHPRYLPLLKNHGIPEGIGNTSSTNSSLKNNLVAVTITFITEKEEKSIAKKLPHTMTVAKLKGLLQRLFKVQTVKQKLTYIDMSGHEVEMDDDLRPLSFYSLESGGTVTLKYG